VRRSWRKWRPIFLALALAAALIALPHPHAGASDIFGNVGPASQLSGGSLVDRYPLGHYYLDTHFDAVSASLTGGVDVSGVPSLIAGFLANALWEGTAFLAKTLISLFTFAFSLDLLNGSRSTGGEAASATSTRRHSSGPQRPGPHFQRASKSQARRAGQPAKGILEQRLLRRGMPGHWVHTARVEAADPSHVLGNTRSSCSPDPRRRPCNRNSVP
jgi:hypothetical protein